MKFHEILGQVKSILTDFSGVHLSFGKPMTVNEMTIIPVAKSSLGFGGGGGSNSPKHKVRSQNSPDPGTSTETHSDITSEPKTSKPDDSFGGGGGGGMKTDPIGIYVIRGENIRFYPVLKYEQILGTLVVVSTIIIRFIKLKRK